MVADYEEVESPSPTCSFANIKIVTFWFWYLEIEKVKGNLTCLKLIFNYTLKFNLAQNNYYLIINSREDISCHSLNFIHLLSYNNFNKWCVGETVQQLYKWINTHWKTKSGCENLIKHFRDSCFGSAFNMWVRNISWYWYSNSNICPLKCKRQLDKQDYWMKTVRKIYPYGLNEKPINHDNNLPVGHWNWKLKLGNWDV